MSGSRLQLKINKVRADSVDDCDDFVAVEEPLEIRLGYDTPDGRTSTSLSITMRTPGDDAALAVGFLWSEGIIDSMSAVSSVQHVGPATADADARNIVRVDLAAGISVDLDKLQRHFYTTSSCGVCGKSSLDALRVSVTAPLPQGAVRFPRKVITRLPDVLRATQATFDTTGGLHAAALFDSQGEILISREDIGRHNAVDKVIGAMLTDGSVNAAECGLIVSGRASFELLQKTLVAGIPLLAAVSAPSSLAVRLAKEFNVTLIGFLRGDSYNVYSAGERLL